MKRMLLATVVLFAAVASARADDAARAVVEKAIKAAGWGNDPADLKTSWKDKGVFFFMGQKLDYTADWTFAAPDKYHFLFKGDFGGMKVELTVVANGMKGWEAAMGQNRDITGEKLEYVRNETYQMHALMLVPLLKDKAFKLSELPEKKVDEQPTAGVEVKREGRPTIKLYFDKTTGLLAKAEMMNKDEFQNWKEVLEESYFTGWKDVGGGRKGFTKMKTVRDGKTLIETELSDQKVLDKVDAKLFEKPGS